jgi:uncharacterized protein YgbK (DUF1537 family)
VIGVLADDFTGAAEIGAIGCRYGLEAEVQTGFHRTEGADLVVLDTHTRSSSRAEAVKTVRREMDGLRGSGVEWIYKKVDSVLRGHVLAEVASALDRSGLRRALLVPANPSFGQVIQEGHYRIDGHPLNETRFAHDPEHPARTDDVLELLGPVDGIELAYREDPRSLPATGIVVTAVSARSDLVELARLVDAETLPAGAAEFFGAALERHLGRNGNQARRLVDRRPQEALFVLGSRSEHGRALLSRAQDDRVSTVFLPAAGPAEAPVEPWVDRALNGLRERAVVILAVDRDGKDPSRPSSVHRLPRRLASVTEAVVRSWPGDDLHLFIEGGTTASTIIRRLGWERLRVQGEFGSGVVTLTVPGDGNRLVTVKPGNYPWPESIRGWFE